MNMTLEKLKESKQSEEMKTLCDSDMTKYMFFVSNNLEIYIVRKEAYLNYHKL